MGSGALWRPFASLSYVKVFSARGHRPKKYRSLPCVLSLYSIAPCGQPLMQAVQRAQLMPSSNQTRNCMQLYISQVMPSSRICLKGRAILFCYSGRSLMSVSCVLMKSMPRLRLLHHRLFAQDQVTGAYQYRRNDDRDHRQNDEGGGARFVQEVCIHHA